MGKNNPTLEELLELASAAPDPKEDPVLNDVEQWVIENGVQSGNDEVAKRIVYLIYKEWSLAPYSKNQFFKIMNTKFECGRNGYLLSQDSIELARQHALKQIGMRRYAQKKRRAKKID